MDKVSTIDVKPFVTWRKDDAADTEAICEATQRQTMRIVAVKGEVKEAATTVFRIRDLLMQQRTQTINALCGQFVGDAGQYFRSRQRREASDHA